MKTLQPTLDSRSFDTRKLDNVPLGNKNDLPEYEKPVAPVQKEEPNSFSNDEQQFDISDADLPFQEEIMATFKKRKKVCYFTENKIEKIDWKDADLLRHYIRSFERAVFFLYKEK